MSKREDGLCEVEECENVAHGWVEAQWSIFDVLRVEVCYHCMRRVAGTLDNRMVDGEAPQVVWTGYYE